MVICTQCGDKVGTTGWSDRCYGCQLDPLLPEWYERQERYYYFADPSIPPIATQHPRTGIGLLDNTPLRLSQLALPKAFNPHRM